MDTMFTFHLFNILKNAFYKIFYIIFTPKGYRRVPFRIKQNTCEKQKKYKQHILVAYKTQHVNLHSTLKKIYYILYYNTMIL